MSNHSIQLAYPDGYTLPASNKTVFTTGPNNANDQQAGIYDGIPSISLSGSQTVPVCGLIHCAGYSSAMIHPVCVTDNANAIAVYGFWGFNESGDTPRKYICHLITTMSVTAITSAAGPRMTSPGGTAYVGMGAMGTISGGVFSALDRTGPGMPATGSISIGGVATTSTNASIATLGIPYLNGADYLAILYNTNNAAVDAQHNCYVILTEQERY
jgi:hypothetical protein